MVLLITYLSQKEIPIVINKISSFTFEWLLGVVCFIFIQILIEHITCKQWAP